MFQPASVLATVEQLELLPTRNLEAACDLAAGPADIAEFVTAAMQQPSSQLSGWAASKCRAVDAQIIS